jgi:AraC-like DNA-binding protein
MCSMLQRPAVDHDLCRRNYLEAPGDLAHEVRNANLLADPASTPRGTGLWVSAIDTPLPFHVRSASGYTAAVNLGEAFHMGLRIASEKESLSLEPGSTYLQPPGCDLHLTCSGLQTYRLLSFGCEASHLETAALSADLPFHAQGLAHAWSAKSDPQTLAIGQAIVAELRSHQCMPMLLETLTQALAIQVVRRASGTRKEVPRPASGLAPYILQRVIDYVHEHIQDPLSLDALASVAGLSTYHFCRMFRRSTGLPPYQYLAQLRIARAKESLLQTTLPVGDIAFGMGFGSSSQFSHCFKKVVGCTPQEYRRQAMRPAPTCR